MALRPTSPIHARWHANRAHCGRGCLMKPRRWSARGWDTRTGWDSEDRSHARNLELISPWGQWRHTVDTCMRWNPQSTGANCRLVIQITNPRYEMWALRCRLSDAPALSPAAWGTPSHVMAFFHNIYASTGGIGSGFWSSTPTPSPSASAAGEKSQWGY